MKFPMKAGWRSWPIALLLGGALCASAAEDKTEERFIPRYAAGDAYYLWSTRSDLDSPPGASMQVQEAGFRIPVPVFSTENSRLTAGAQFRWNELDFEGPPILGGSLDLYRLQLPIDYWHDFDDHWRAWGRIEPGLFTDFKDLDSDAFAVTVLALGSYRFSEKFSAAFGLYYSRDLGEDRLLPALGLIWDPNPHWNLGLTFPRASLSYAPTKTWLFSLSAGPGGAGWSITPEGGGENQRLNYKSWRLSLGAEYQFIEVGPARLWAFATLGHQFGQELELERDDLTLLDTDLESGQFVSGGIRLRF